MTKLEAELRKKYVFAPDFDGASDVYDLHIPCWYGRVSVFNARKRLLKFTYCEPKKPVPNAMRFLGRLLNAGCLPDQTGDDEFSVLFHKDQFESLHELLAPERVSTIRYRRKGTS